jgi:hypothetical protein
MRYCCLSVAMLLSGGAFLTGCATTESTTANMRADANPYAGGNGAFGEDPVNPGQYASARQDAGK